MNFNDDHPSSSKDTQVEYDDPDIPDRSYGDFFCKICDSHMNSDNMWDAHISGKRHIKNVKKGDIDSKYEDLPDEESSVKTELRNVKDPIVGLSYIHEIRRKEPNVPPIYNCFLCHATIATIPLVTEHVISMKHRLNYIKENNPEEWQLIEATNLKKGHMEPLVEDAARSMEQKFGRGNVKVKREKTKKPVTTYSSKNKFNLEEESDWFQKSSRNPKVDITNPWKSVDSGKKFGLRERSRSPRDFEDNFTNRARSRSPRDFKGRKRVYYSDEENSVDSHKKKNSKRNISPRQDDFERYRSLSKREISPRQDFERRRSFLKRDVSPGEDELEKLRYFSRKETISRVDDSGRNRSSFTRDFSSMHEDYHLKSTDDYSPPPNKIDSRNKPSYISTRYEHTSSQEYVKTSNTSNHQKPVSLQPPSSYSLLHEKSVENTRQPKTLEAIFQDTLLLSNLDSYKLIIQRMKAIPVITDYEEVALLFKIMTHAQYKLKNQMPEKVFTMIVEKVRNSNNNSANNIPGLGDSVSPSAEPHTNQTQNSYLSANSQSFINNILQGVNLPPVCNIPASQNTISYKPPSLSFPHPESSSYRAASVVSSQHTSPVNSRQTLSTNTYQAPTTSFAQLETRSYPNQEVYQHPNTNPVFSSVNVSNYSRNTPSIPGLSLTENTPDSQIYNYSHYSPQSSTSKNYLHKF